MVLPGPEWFCQVDIWSIMYYVNYRVYEYYEPISFELWTYQGQDGHSNFLAST